MLKIISWNVNGFRSVVRKGTLQELFESENPDIVLLQEIKCNESHMMSEIPEGYESYINAGTIAGRHGTAIIFKSELELDAIVVDPLVDGAQEGRLQAATLDGMLIINSYSVNVRNDLSRIKQRYSYDSEIRTLLTQWSEHSQDNEVIVLGDLNVVSEPIDYHKNCIDKTMAGMTDTERGSFKDLLSTQYGLTDTFRHYNPEITKYSYWSNYSKARERDKGWRLDYALATNSVLDRIQRSDILTNVMGSDHAPIIIEIG